MAGTARRGITEVLAGLALLAVAHAPAQAQAYRCGPHTYSQVPCTGGRALGATPHHVTDKAKPPPQDRAVAARRAVLTPEERLECRALDGQLLQEQRILRAKGDAATLDDEMPLVRAQKKFRELHC